MQWTDTGFVLAARRHGESALVVELLTREHGRHLGLVRGGQSPKRRAILQPGNEVSAVWRGRLPEHLGMLDCELLRANAVLLLDDPARLAALAAAAALLAASLGEREPQPEIFAGFAQLLAALDSDRGWEARYVEWECELLARLGFGLDFSCCAATGAIEDLAYVSPRSGRAVSRAAAAPYRDKLLALPEFLWRRAEPDRRAIAEGLALTGHFLLHQVLAPQGRGLPEARLRFAALMERRAAAGMIGR